MNPQKKYRGGKLVSRGIEWTDFTWNPARGCSHDCQWKMGGEIVNCYAEDVAENLAQAAYPQGFSHHYWNPEKLAEPERVKTPSKIFLDSMSDLMGKQVPDDQIAQVFETVAVNPHHQFQLLTKNPPRLLQVPMEFPKNLWVGCSSPPDFMFGHEMTPDMQLKMLRRTLNILNGLKGFASIRWMSLEPYSWDMVPYFAEYPHALDWVVIGAGSNGKKYYQPDPDDFRRVVTFFERLNVPIFFKGNVRASVTDDMTWHEEFPNVV